jgi:hypothetical protein
MGTYARDTAVTPDKTLQEIRQTLTRYKASKFGMIEEESRVGLAFEMSNRRVRFIMPLPDANDKAFRNKASGVGYSRGQFNQNKYDQAIRQRWRALLLTIKAKLESVESGIESFDEAFAAQLVLPDGRTVGEWMKPQIAQAYENGKMPPMLGSGG